MFENDDLLSVVAWCVHSTSTGLLAASGSHVGQYFDPPGQPKVTAGSGHCFRTCCISSLFKSRKSKQQNTMFASGMTMGLAEWIIDDTYLVSTILIDIVMILWGHPIPTAVSLHSTLS